MAQVNSTREAHARTLQTLRDDANINTRYNATTLREVANRATATSKQRATQDGKSAVAPHEINVLERNRGLGNLIDRKA